MSIVSNYNTGRPITTAKLASWLPRVKQTTSVAMSDIDSGAVACNYLPMIPMTFQRQVLRMSTACELPGCEVEVVEGGGRRCAR